MSHQILLWILFNVFVLLMLALDLGVFHRRTHEVRVREALIWTMVWIALALLFCGGIYLRAGSVKAVQFLTGYLIEKSLSVDNIFVFLLIFGYFGVAPRYQHKVLLWGILGALIMRALFILTGITMMKHLHWIIYVFGAFLIYTGFKLMVQKNKQIHPDKNPVLRLFKRFMPVTERIENDRFFVRRAGRLLATPLFIVVLVIESTDVVFAVDSIPAILAITVDPFIVYSSNVFAILGLRALYFALAGFMQLFHYLHYGLAAILAFVGAKMLVSEYYKIPAAAALGVIVGVLLVSVLASLLIPAAEKT
ncbi:TerC family protein [bacterium]|nr:TerC family protein [candidate division CSSED10-310 bacterium]